MGYNVRVLLHLRITVPPDRTGEVVRLLEDCPGTAHVAVLPGVSLVPAGDLVMADVARESADGLVRGLRGIGIDEDGAITLEGIDAAVSHAARRAEELAPGDGTDAVIWEQVVRTTAADSALSVSYLAFLVIATLLAGIAIVVDSAVLVIGAMVLGPEFGPLAGLAVAAVHRRPSIARSAAKALVVGFSVAILATTLAGLVGRGLGWFDASELSDDRPQTGFITAPDRWSLIVAVLAGVAGVLSLTAAKSGALVGVFISVTTVPAAADIGLSLALEGGTELVRAATQLGINLVGILLAATVTLAVQKYLWHRLPRTSPRVDAVGPRLRR
ncbi:DUF389 domain-containing protein [Geodermatophilus sp. DSM 44513]|uniref:DUF389 domain-containing protein n=1 Tax=Geodermatophilus sp. DSM 44513 TaxID=1528104 RepID=UPI00128714AF|nr:DUF389 domain-containing protein [Geodermatophilus sp. DSM 44513]WNV75369.1 DUF389 domain-containing protein [Geodermatophilus sp. DSM 44513]